MIYIDSRCDAVGSMVTARTLSERQGFGRKNRRGAHGTR